MYFFLSNLSLADVGFISTTVPKMIVNIQTQSKSISYAGCITQMYFFMVFGVMDTFLLTVMAYDRFVAICHPLHYTVIMNPCLCGLLVLVSWFTSLSYSLIQSLLMLRLSFCTNWVIPHFYCELAQVLTLACSDTLINYIFLYMVTGQRLVRSQGWLKSRECETNRENGQRRNPKQPQQPEGRWERRGQRRELRRSGDKSRNTQF